MDSQHHKDIEQTNWYANVTRLSLSPGRHNAAELASALKTHISRIDFTNFNSDDEIPPARAWKFLQCMAANQANGGQRFKLDNFTTPDYAEFLEYLFRVFNTIFFMDLLPPTRVFQASRTFAAQALETETSTRPTKLVILGDASLFRSHKAEITLRDFDGSWNHIGELLGAMIELYLKYFGCGCEQCREDQQGYGNTGYGEAWQHIACVLEYSPFLRVKISYVFFQRTEDLDLGFHRRRLYAYELGSWDEPERKIAANKEQLENWGWETDWNEILYMAHEEKKKREGRMLKPRA